MRAASLLLSGTLILALCTACTSGRAGSSAPTVGSAAPTAAVIAPAYPFGTASFWRSSLANAPVDPDSQTMTDYLVASITDRYSGVAAFNAHQYDSHLYTVSADTPRTDFAFNNCQNKARTPTGLLGPGGQFTGVPVPAGAVAATGSDAEISFYSPATDQVWEFWKAAKSASGTWSACWGGRIDHASSSPGYFLGGFGATATGLPNAGGLVRLAEVQSSSIDHAISISIPNPAQASDFSWPAQRSDGVDTSPAAIPEGTRLRLDPSLDLSTLGLSRAGLVVAKAAQQYGFIVVDRSGSVSVLAEAVDKVDGVDPWRQALGVPDYAVLKNFPWTRIQVIAKDFGKPAS